MGSVKTSKVSHSKEANSANSSENMTPGRRRTSRSNGKKEPVSCDDCGKKISNPGDLSRHRRTHNNFGPCYICCNCNRQCRELHNLVTHMETKHYGENENAPNNVQHEGPDSRRTLIGSSDLNKVVRGLCNLHAKGAPEINFRLPTESSKLCFSQGGGVPYYYLYVTKHNEWELEALRKRGREPLKTLVHDVYDAFRALTSPTVSHRMSEDSWRLSVPGIDASTTMSGYSYRVPDLPRASSSKVATAPRIAFDNIPHLTYRSCPSLSFTTSGVQPRPRSQVEYRHYPDGVLEDSRPVPSPALPTASAIPNPQRYHSVNVNSGYPPDSVEQRIGSGLTGAFASPPSPGYRPHIATPPTDHSRRVHSSSPFSPVPLSLPTLRPAKWTDDDISYARRAFASFIN
ncbi:unnamed protein product [Somion occarium]|uniref:C2H2-type domain-containing protein n=1 Tax=Somion occarium TaxID=3059160 RepID=A0ABP1DRX3_9APHY